MGKQPETDRRVRTILEEIHPGFVESGAKTITSQDIDYLVEHSDDVLTKFTQGGALRRYAREIGNMVSLVKSYASGEYLQVPVWTIAVIGFVLLYVLKPIDIIPDSLPVIGQLDDAIIVGHGLHIVRNELEVYEEWCREARSDGRRS